MNITDLDLFYYELELVKFSDELTTNDISYNGRKIELIFRPSSSSLTNAPDLDNFLKDIKLMSKIRMEASSQPVVKDALDQLLTVMALTK